MNVASELYMVVTRRNTKNVVDRNTHRIRSWDKKNNKDDLLEYIFCEKFEGLAKDNPKGRSSKKTRLEPIAYLN